MMNDGVEDLRLKYGKLIYQEYVSYASFANNLLCPYYRFVPECYC